MSRRWFVKLLGLVSGLWIPARKMIAEVKTSDSVVVSHGRKVRVRKIVQPAYDPAAMFPIRSSDSKGKILWSNGLINCKPKRIDMDLVHGVQLAHYYGSGWGKWVVCSGQPVEVTHPNLVMINVSGNESKLTCPECLKRL